MARSGFRGLKDKLSQTISNNPVAAMLALVAIVAVGFFFGSASLTLVNTKFNPHPTPSSSPVSSPQPSPAPRLQPPEYRYYEIPDDWQTLDLTKTGISICLPPEWRIDNPNLIIAKDPENKDVIISHITIFPLLTGNIKNTYLQQKFKDHPQKDKLIGLAKVTQYSINQLPILEVNIPDYPTALVTVYGNHIFEFTIENTTQLKLDSEEISTDFSTILGCGQPL